MYKSNKTRKLIVQTLLLTIACGLMAINACRKSNSNSKPAAAPATVSTAVTHAEQGLSAVYHVATVRKSADGQTATVMFTHNEEIFTAPDARIISVFEQALTAGTLVRVVFNPWSATIVQATAIQGTAARGSLISGPSDKVDIATDAERINKAYASINTTSAGLTPVIPDMATAQAMFDYITHQCCALTGPYAVDYCISFQYCEDGCYARAHKMCWILNNRYHYATQKVFSFANSGSDELCVQAEKWNGCCINWWYHVAPLVTINTPAGPRAYVFDPAMFDQPVLLTEWLHAQQNPACVPAGCVPHVSMINVQPTSAYWPEDYSGTVFGTDSAYASTDTTLVNYSHLVSCP
jgi:hypothetical protein